MTENPAAPLRRPEDIPLANQSLAQLQRHALGAVEAHAHPQAWLEPAETRAFLTSPATVLIDARGVPLAWKGERVDPTGAYPAVASFLIRHPWDVLRANELQVGLIEASRIEGGVHAGACVEGLVWVGAGTRILPGVFIEGKVVIGCNCKIGPNCYLRGNTSIGDGCHIGQSVEIKNSLVLSNTNVGHLSYVGDSVLGEGVNLGAGTTISNLRHDGANHRSMVDGVLVDTGRRKFGAILGDGVHTGINTSIYPGRKLWPGTSTRPGEIVRRDVTGRGSNDNAE